MSWFILCMVLWIIGAYALGVVVGYGLGHRAATRKYEEMARFIRKRS